MLSLLNDLEELFELHLPAAVLVNVIHYSFDLLSRVAETQGNERLLKFLDSYAPYFAD